MTCRRGSNGGSAAGTPVSVGPYAYEGHIVHVICAAAVATNAAHAGVKRTNGEVAVVGTAPAPVDMELAAIVISIEHKTVACRHIATRIEDWALLVELGTQQCTEIRITVVLSGNGRHVGSILEEFHKRRLRRATDSTIGVVIVCSTGRWTVAHLSSHTDMIHQSCHCIHLRRTAGTCQSVGHVGPLVGSGAKISCEVREVIVDAVDGAVAGVCMASIACGRVIIVFHHLGCGCGHTACHRTVARGGLGA